MEDRFRRPRDELFEAEAVELAPSEEGEVVMQLSDKIRQQAKRLTSLEQYRLLIEKRLRELSPSHPLPVQPTHLGKDVPDELQALRARVEELEAEQQVPMTEDFTFPHPSTPLKAAQLQELYQALYFKHHSALKDRTALEETLRAEVLTSEEQRAYIEVLKQAVEAKMDTAGVVNQTVDSFAEYTTTRSSQEQSRKDAMKLSSTIRDQEVGIKRLQEQSKQLYESLKNAEAEVERLQEANDETASALLSYEDELQKVTAEKDALLEYVDKHDHSETELKDQINTLQTEISELKTQETLSARTSKQLGEGQRKALEDQEQLRSLIQKHEKSVTQLTLALEEARSRAAEQTEMLTSLREQTGLLQSKNEALQANNCTLSNTLQETQSEFDALQTRYDDVSAELSDATAEVVFLREEVERLTDLTAGLQGTLKETEEIGQQRDLRLTKAEQEFTDLERVTSEQLEKECLKNAELKQRLNKSEENHERLKQKAAALGGELKETQAKLEETRLALRKSEKSAASLELELEDKRLLYGEVKEQFSFTATQKDALASELRKLEIDFTAHHSSARALDDENSSLRARVEELTRNVKVAREGFQDRETRLQRAFSEVTSLRTEDEQLRSKLSQLQAECAAKTQELSLVKANERRLQGDSTTPKKLAEDAAKTSMSAAGLVGKQMKGRD